MEDVHKVCPDCGGEFQAQVEVCPDCGVSLRWSTERFPGSSGAWRSGFQGLEPSPALVLAHYGELDLVRGVAARLAREGIRSFTSLVADPSFTTEELGAGNLQHDGTYYLFVRPEDFEASQVVDRAFLAEQLSEVEELGGFTAERSDVCPACGAYRSEDDEQCPSCELSFRWPGETEAEDH